MVHSYNRILLHMKRREALTHTITWMNPEDMMFSERHQTQEATQYMM